MMMWNSAAGVATGRGVLAWALCLACLVGGSSIAAAGPAPVRKIVLISIDTLRADRLGCYGYGRPTSPRLDAFAQEAMLFERATVPAPWTAPSMAAMITGRYPYETGVYTNQNSLNAGFGSLAETLKEAGFSTAWFNTNPVLMLGATHFKSGFDRVEPPQRMPTKLPYSKVEASVHSWLEDNAAKDFFLWIHDMDPHSPPTEGNPYHKDKTWHVYDGEVRLVDDSMGRLFDKLKSLGIWDEVLVIFTSDHGEAFSEHMLPGHQNVIYDEVLHIPLIVRYPGMKRTGRSSELVEITDLYRTIADLAQVDVPSSVRGESLVPILEGRTDKRKQGYAFHSRYYVKPLGLHYLAVRNREYKLIARVPIEGESGRRMVHHAPTWSLDQPGSTFELYRYTEDPGELKNLIFFGADPGVADGLKSELLNWRDLITGRQPATEPVTVELDEKTRDTLRRLGYDGN